MSTEAILDTVATAAKDRSTLTVHLRTDEGENEAEVEPYSVLDRQHPPTFYCWDLERGRVVGMPVTALLHVEVTGRHFEPRYEVEF